MSETVETAPPVESAAIDVAPTPAVAEAPPVDTAATGETGAVGTPPPAPQQAAPETTVAPETTSDLSFEQVPRSEPVAPVAPTYEFQLPEGRTVEPAQMAAFTELAGKHMLPPETAQDLLNQHLSIVDEIGRQQNEAAEKYWADLKADYSKQLAADPEMGGKNAVAARNSMIEVRDEVLVPKSDGVGFDNLLKTFPALDQHPAFRRLFYRAGQRWAQDQQMKAASNARINPVPQSNPQQDRGPLVYPTMFAKRA